MPDPTISARVQAGAAWLDQHVPGWVADIDLNRLDLASPCRCILGQIHGGEYPTMGEIPGEDGRPANWTTNRTALGFECSPARDGEKPEVWLARTHDEYAALTAEWTRVITACRDAERARVAAACCPCRGPACDPGCTCPAGCPRELAEVLDG